MPKRHDKKKSAKKKRKDAYPKKVCHMSTRHVKKKREEKNIYSPCPRKNTRREIDHAKGSILSSTKNIHTLAPLDLIV